MKTCLKLTVILLVLSINLFPQSFDLNAYKQFQLSTQNMLTSQLLQMHPGGIFNNTVPSLSSILYYDTISFRYSLTPYEKQLISNHNFMVSERLQFQTFGDALKDIFYKDLPVFVSTDAVLHALHRSYDDILVLVEGEYLINRVKELLVAFKNKMSYLNTKYGANPQMLNSLKDYDYYFTVALKLLTENVTPFYSDNNSRIQDVLGKINAEIMQPYSFFGEKIHFIDFSQFKPRGHYVELFNLYKYPLLDDYFKTLIWLGRVEVPLIPAGLNRLDTTLSTTRTTILTALILEAAKQSSAYSIFTEINNNIEAFVGEQDNVTLPDMDWLWSHCNLTDPQQLLDTNKLYAFQDSLLQNPFAFQLINSQIIINGTLSDSIVPASAFMLLGQRFIIDSYITGSVVYDRIKFNGQLVKRMLPNTLDVLFGLGNNAAAQLLQPELEQYHYSANLANLRYLVNSYDDSFWQANLFNSWLSSIRTLNPPLERNNLPQFMQTAAFWQQKMNTQLASWTELRHDNLLYAKQSYTGGAVCYFPYSYVEPFPEFFNAVKKFGEKFKTVISPLPLTNNNKDKIISYCNNLIGAADTLGNIAEKELHNIPITVQESNFLKSMLRIITSSYSTEYDGWYYKMFFIGESFIKKDYLVADIHTAPTDAGGAMVGWVKHVGTGPINLGVFTVNYNGQDVAYVGPFYSYYDYTTTAFQRLTDEEWTSMYLSAALRPDWVNSYLADSIGSNKPAGPNLITSIKDDPSGNIQPEDFIISQNYPNPFNPVTYINFRIPADLSGEIAELNIYDMTGALVKQLFKESLPSGNYIVEWNATDGKNNTVASGNYIYRLMLGTKSVSGKMTFLK